MEFFFQDIPLSRRQTKNSGGRGRPPAKAVDDDEICVVEEKLTPLAKMKAKVHLSLSCFAAYMGSLPDAICIIYNFYTCSPFIHRVLISMSFKYHSILDIYSIAIL